MLLRKPGEQRHWAMFSFGKGKKEVVRLEKFLRDRIAAAGEEFDKTKPSWFKIRGSKGRNRLGIHPMLVNGFNHALRAIFVAGAPPAGVVHMTTANVIIDMMMNYHKKIPPALATSATSGASSLSFNIVNNDKISSNFKFEVERMRNSLQAAIYATAEFIEMEQLSSLKEALDANVDPNKKAQIKRFVDSQYQFHVSYRSMAIALQLFSCVNQEMLRKIKSSRTRNAEETRELLAINAVFVYEIADLIGSFLNAFSLQGVKELRKIHEEVLSEVELGRIENISNLDRIKSRQLTKSLSMLNLDVEALSVQERLNALGELDTIWTAMMSKVDEAENGAYSFRDCIADLEIIKSGAAANLRILDLVSITKMVQTNIEAMEGMLQIDRLQLPPITPDDVLSFLGVKRQPRDGDGTPKIPTDRPN